MEAMIEMRREESNEYLDYYQLLGVVVVSGCERVD